MKRNIILTVAALTTFAVGFLFYQQATLAYNVIIDNEPVAQVKDVQDWEEALAGHKADVAESIGREVHEAGEIVLQKTHSGWETPVTDLNRVVRDKVVLTVEAPTLFVDGQPLLSVLSTEALNAMLDEYKQKYIPSATPGATVLAADFRQKVEVKTAVTDVTSVLTDEEARGVLFEVGAEAGRVEVQAGDNLWQIAKDRGTTVDAILNLNPTLDAESIKPGESIIVTQETPLLDMVVELTNTVVEDIPYNTEYKTDAGMFTRDRLVLRRGVPGSKKVTYRVTMINGYQRSLDVVSEVAIKQPVTQVTKVGTRKVLSRGVSRNYGVVNGTRVSSSFGWRTHPILGTKKFHAGLDIAAPHGNGVYAYASGTVIYAGQAGGYGNVVYIDHGDNLETRYAHLSRINVSTGQRVAAGTKIGAVGSSGVSTGPHLHFEVRKNGEPQSPWEYL